ncbi:glycoside hydrolase family 18 protein [Terribacillus sp. DMT04]|uniref:glycoside hydrolase family 18 protein n=1 Tax=Terribacillus sp. DMT04 TaxID=2850441 RepID=UPI001C2C2CB9|nr:glycoside hydrolase family 18 protein [Terribacillus sp. DMT04]QXE01754.1 glycoside hydrolase family 18 protein [Terribacillus sp. DMT04]
MQIYTVQRGDTVTSIASRYGTTSQELITANELEAPNNLVIGQALVIPIIGSFYYVQTGDSLYSIARKNDLTAAEIARINNISETAILQPGLRLYLPAKPKTELDSNAYIEPSGNTVSQTLETAARQRAPYLTYLMPFSYKVDRQGNLTAPPLNDFATIAENNNTTLSLAISTIEGGQFSEELGKTLVTDTAVQDRLFTNIIDVADDVGFREVHFDIEFLPAENREDYNNFLRRAVARLRPQGLRVSTAVAPKTSASQQGQWYEAHDYAAHGEIVDFVVLMTYEWGYSGGPPLAVSPLPNVRDVVEYALTEMPANKIVLGQNLYGYDWTLPYEPGGDYAKAVSPQRAIAIARENNVSIQYDTTAQAPFFTYTDADGAQHEVWFEDARSIQAKFDLIKELNLRGISYWKLGLSFPQNWLLLQDNFTIRKL